MDSHTDEIDDLLGEPSDLSGATPTRLSDGVEPLPPRDALYKRELLDRYVQSLASTLSAAFLIWLVASLAGYGHTTHGRLHK